MTTITILANTPETKHAAAVQLYQQTKQDGRMWEFRACTVEDHKRVKMRAALHRYILPDIALQARVFNPRTGRHEHWTVAAWKETLRDLFIAPIVQEYTTKDGELKVRVLRRSTEDLTDDEYQDFLLMVQAYAVVDLHVTFTEENPAP